MSAPVKYWDRTDAKMLANMARYRGAVARGDRFGVALAKIAHRFWLLVSAADVDIAAEIDPSVRLPHPNGVVVHPGAVVGPDCLLMQQTTLGVTDGAPPRLGRGVYVGAGAKILGAVTIGDGAKIGANAVVLIDVPAGATAVGVPARIVSANAAGPGIATAEK